MRTFACTTVVLLCVVAMSATAAEPMAPVADEATIALVHFDKAPLEDAGPNKLAVKQKAPTLGEGRFGQAIDCRGEGIACVPIPADKAPKTAMTLECWMYVEDFGEGKLPWPVGRNGLHGLYLRRQGKGFALRYYLRLKSEVKPKIWTGLTFKVPAKEWFHVAVTYDGKEMNAYLNGQRVSNRKIEGEIVHSRAQLFFGTSDAKGNNRFVGKVDEVRYSNIARTEFPGAKPE